VAILFDKENKLIFIESPSTEVTIQELVRAIRNFEDSIIGMDIERIADASGKENLGGGLFVGITLKLLNWKLKFEPRLGPDVVLCDVGGGNLIAVSGSEDNEVFVNPIDPSAFTSTTKTSAVSAALLNATSPSDVADAVWDEKLADHTGSAESAGYALDNVSAGASPAQIADAVWDETLSEHTGSDGTAASRVGYILGLLQNNFRMTDHVYDSNNLLTSAKLKIYNNSVDAEADTNSLKEWTITAAYTDNNLTEYLVKE
jgi:hypothetical protein